MSRPLFAVGEEVWLIEIGINPIATIVTDVHLCIDDLCPICKWISSFGYLIADPPFPDEPGTYWCQCALRKRYPPADSFASIMDSCKDKVPA